MQPLSQINPRREMFTETLTVTASTVAYGTILDVPSVTYATPIIEQLSGSPVPTLTLQASFDKAEWHTLHTVTETTTTTVGGTIPTSYNIFEQQLRLKVDNSAGNGTVVVKHNLICDGR